MNWNKIIEAAIYVIAVIILIYLIVIVLFFALPEIIEQNKIIDQYNITQETFCKEQGFENNKYESKNRLLRCYNTFDDIKEYDYDDYLIWKELKYNDIITGKYICDQYKDQEQTTTRTPIEGGEVEYSIKGNWIKHSEINHCLGE